jgi:hypothetical protein
MRFATLATACVAALTSVNAQAIDQAYIGVSPSLFSSLLPSIEVSRWSSKVEVSIVMGIAADRIEFLYVCASRFRTFPLIRASRRPLDVLSISISIFRDTRTSNLSISIPLHTTTTPKHKPIKFKCQSHRPRSTLSPAIRLDSTLAFTRFHSRLLLEQQVIAALTAANLTSLADAAQSVANTTEGAALLGQLQGSNKTLLGTSMSRHL